MIKRTRLLLAFSCVLIAAVSLFVSCSKSRSIKWVYYDETQCSDPWTFTNNREILKENIKSHCKTQGVDIYEMEIFIVQDPETCSDCVCKTGRQYKCKIAASDLSKAQSMGFFEK